MCRYTRSIKRPPVWRPPAPPPQGVRSMCRFFLAFFVPVFFGPYWAYVKNQTNFAFAFFFSIIVSLCGRARE